MKYLILGVGNEVRMDDGVGIIIAKELSKRIEREDVDFREAPQLSLGLLEVLRNYDLVFIVDSVVTKHGEVGEWHSLDLEDLDNVPQRNSLHAINLKTLWKIGKEENPSMPIVQIFAVEVADPFTFGEGLTEEVEKNLSKVIDEISEEIKNRL